MPKWDYVCVNLVRSYGMNYRRNGIKMGDWKDKPLFEMMQIMGDEGYEFAAYDGQNYIFKKPIQPAQPQPGSQQVRTAPPAGTNPQQGPRPVQPTAGQPQGGQPRPPTGVQSLQRPAAGVQPLQRPAGVRPIQPLPDETDE